ncbi:unnamed protein product [Leuciscus chuanchicus]
MRMRDWMNDHMENAGEQGTEDWDQEREDGQEGLMEGEGSTNTSGLFYHIKLLRARCCQQHALRWIGRYKKMGFRIQQITRAGKGRLIKRSPFPFPWLSLLCQLDL